MLLSENFHTSINIFCWPWNSVSLSITLPSFGMLGQLVTKIWEILNIKRLEYARLGRVIWAKWPPLPPAERGRNDRFVQFWLIFRATGVPIQVVLYLISPIFLLPIDLAFQNLAKLWIRIHYSTANKKCWSMYESFPIITWSNFWVQVQRRIPRFRICRKRLRFALWDCVPENRLQFSSYTSFFNLCV